MNVPPDIPVGDLELFDDYVPGLDAGNWYLGVTHTVLDASTSAPVSTPFGAVQEFVVSAPQFAIDTREIVSMYPPASSTGQYGEVLPNVVLREPLLPWERPISSGTQRQPWLALLVLGADEANATSASATGAIATTVGAFLAASDATVLKPDVTKADDVADSDPMMYVQISTGVFEAVMPRLDELRFLTHVRQANTGDRALLGIDEHGLFSVVAANRFPAAPAGLTGAPVRSVAHLVSVEGLQQYLVDAPSFGSAQSVALVSLASWSFFTAGAPQQDFRGLMEAIVAEGRAGTAPAPDAYRLRLASAGVAGASPEAARRLDDGFAPLEYVTRSGEGTFAWYRGPLTPYPIASAGRTDPFLTSDAAISYQPDHGVFDLSLAAAFEIGRAAAIADKAFGQQLLALRTSGHRFTDTLLGLLVNDAFSAADIAALSGATVQDELRALLKTDLLSDLGEPAPPAAAPPPAPRAPAPPLTPQQALSNLLADPNVQAALAQAVAADLDPVATWLGRLLLLAGIPFHYLVPDDAMLPPESLRTFCLDANWLEAMLDGALAIGMASSRDTFFSQIVGDTLRAAAYDALEDYRESLPGSGPAPPSAGTDEMTGLLLRSAVVTGWPNLAVRPTDVSGALMKTLRMDRLSPTVLLCVFSGTPATIEIAEPQEGFRFGLDDDGNAALRHVLAPAAPGDPQVGQPFSPNQTVPVRDPTGQQALLMRDALNRVLDVDRLVPQMAASVGAASGLPGPVAPFGPADLALQLVDAPEAVIFTAQAGGPDG